jgi:hypothetical protein
VIEVMAWHCHALRQKYSILSRRRAYQVHCNLGKNLLTTLSNAIEILLRSPAEASGSMGSVKIAVMLIIAPVAWFSLPGFTGSTP